MIESGLLGNIAMIKKFLLVVVLFMALFAASGCQTVDGLGRDISWTSKAISDALNGH